MPWTLPQVEKYLLKEYNLLINPKKRFAEFANWVSALIADQDENFQAQRLACCIALDTYHNLVDKKDYIFIFNNMDYTTPGLRLVSRFKIAAIDHQQKMWSCLSNCQNKPVSTNGPYGVIMLRKQFVKRYENWDPKIKSKSNDDLVLEDYQKWLSGKSYRYCTPVVVTHPNFWVGWVFPDRDLSSHDAGVICDSLGLVGYENQVLVRLTYPDDFGELVHHSSTAEADWGNDNLFMSFDKKTDNFGRTRSRSGDDPTKRIKEHVHSPPNGSKYVYKYSYLEPHPLTPINWKNIINECLNRFDT